MSPPPTFKRLQSRIERVLWEKFDEFLNEPQAAGRRSVRRKYGAHSVEPRSFAAVIREYLSSDKFRRLAPATQASYFRYLEFAEAADNLGALPIGVVTPAKVQQCLDKLADRPGAMQRLHVALRCVEEFALPRDLLPFPICTGTTFIRSDGGHKPWTEEQVALVERFARPDIARIITLGVNTGQRGSDLCRMRWSDIEEVDGYPGIKVTQRKTGLRIWIPFTEALRHAIETWERRPTFILLKANGEPYRERRDLTKAWESERERNAALRPCEGLVLHGLRATAVVRLRRAGATTPQIVDMVGLSAQMVERYSRFADQRQSALAAVLHLDRRANRTGQEPQKVTFDPKLRS